MRTFRLDLIAGYSRLDDTAVWLIKMEKPEFRTLRRAQKVLRTINLKLGLKLGKSDYLPRIDIVCSDGKRYKWGS